MLSETQGWTQLPKRMTASLLLATTIAAGTVIAGAQPAGQTAPRPAQATSKTKKIKAWEFTSKRYQVALLELYTSQECESCPPVDAFLTNLPRDGYGFDRVVPAAFHVSYWAHLGWTDALAREEFVERHRLYNASHGGHPPYTPQVVLNDENELLRDRPLQQRIDRYSMRPPPMKLTVRVELSLDGRDMAVLAQADRSAVETAIREPSFAQFAIIEMGIEQAITGGENKGKTLRYDYVVRRLLPEANIRPEDDIVPMGFGPFKLDPQWKVEKLGIVGWVRVRASGAVQQAVGGLLDPAKASVETIPD